MHSSIAIALPLERAHDGVDGIDIGPREVVLAFDHEGHGQCLAGDAAPYRATIVAVMEYDAERPWIRFPAIGGTSASPGRQRSLFELGSGALEDDQAADSLRFLPEDWAADLYLSARPTWAPELIDEILRYAGLSVTLEAQLQPALQRLRTRSVALDVGCGSATLTIPLAQASTLDRIVGVDPSPQMLAVAKAVKTKVEGETGQRLRCEFVQGYAEELAFCPDGEVALCTMAMAAHWTLLPYTFKEARRILKPGGTLALLGYSDGLLPQYPETEAIRARYLDRRLAPFWQQPTRTICNSTDSRAIYDSAGIPLPSNDPSALETAEEIAEHGDWNLTAFSRIKFDLFDPVDGLRCFEPRDDVALAPHEPRPEHRPAIMRKMVTLDEWAADVRTYSAVMAYDRANEDEGGRSLVDDMLDEIVQLLESKGVSRSEPIEVAWAVTLVLLRKAD